MKGGYVGKILRVDLTSGKIIDDGLPNEDTLRNYLGCYGLGLRYLYDELPTGVAPLDPANPLIFMAGPLTGLDVAGPTNLTLTTKNADTGFTVGRSHTHGWMGIRLRQAGYDGIIITGKAEKPVYLWIHDGGVEIRDAGKFWGKDTHETEDLVREELKQPKACVAAIGPAGENLCYGAMIVNEKYHSFAHSGVGTVMGSKKLKAIAVYGEGNIPVANPDKVSDVGKQWRRQVMALGRSIARQGLRRSDYRSVFKSMGFCGKNFQINQLEEYGLGWHLQRMMSRGCPKCPVACTYDCEITTGPYKGRLVTMGGGGEALEGAGSILGIVEPGTHFYLVDLYDRLGVEGSAIGCTMAMAIEAFEMGLITGKDTDGLELAWGDAELAEKLLRKYVYRDGFGDILARGMKAAAEYIGGDAPKFAVHVKGGAINRHDWRATWGILFGQIIGSAAGWTSPGADNYNPEPDAGYPEKPERLNHRGKAEEVVRTGRLKSMNDCNGVCWFETWGLPGVLGFVSEAISAGTGWDVSREELLEIGERVMHLERAFNVKHGLTPEDDYNVPDRLVDAPKDGPAAGKSIKPYLPGMIKEYYELMGWDSKSGKPWRSTLEKFGLSDVARELWG